MKKHPTHTTEIARRYRAFAVRYIGPTDTRGGRVKITDTRNAVSVVVPYTSEFSNCDEYALAYLAERKISVTGMTIAWRDSDSLLLTEDFETPLR